MRAKKQLLAALQDIVKDMGLAWPEKATIDTPKATGFGDLAANIALVLAKQAILAEPARTRHTHCGCPSQP